MTDTSHPRPTTRSSPSYLMSSNNVSGWTGWVIFAGIMLIMVGAFVDAAPAGSGLARGQKSVPM